MAYKAAVDAAQIATSAVTAPKLAVIDADGLAPVLMIYKSFAAGGGGAPDDVTIYNANAPFGFRILSVGVIVLTVVALSTVQLRSATGGGGSTLSGALSAAVALRVPDLVSTTTFTVAANGTLVLRRLDHSV
jgi:NAD(P)H-hydrate repair Nnr-like enzyme with NAD(P)H-hydrate dehydratase domain